MINYKVWQILEGKVPPREHHDIKPYHTRWAITRDLPEIAELVRRHPDFHGIENIGEKIKKLISERDMIGVIAEDESGKIVGFMIYQTADKRYEVPVIVADNPDISYALINRMKNKINAEGWKQNLYVRSHLDDPHVLQSMRDAHMGTAAQGNEIHATYPRINKQQPNLYSKYHSILHGEQPQESPGEDDPYGLFKNSPWGNK